MAEANAMVAALVGDLIALEGIQVTLCWDNRLPPPLFPADRVALFPVAPGDDVEVRWRAAAALCDVVWPIAPESDGLLGHVAALFRGTGLPVVACAADAITLASSKTATAARLAAHGIAAIPTVPFGAPPPPAAHHVVKPDDGAGCLDTFIVDDIAAWTPPHAGRWIVQPLVDGEACSLSMLVDAAGVVRLLGCNRQKVERGKDCFSFHGVDVGMMEHRRAAWEPLARAVAAAIPGLRGYVAVDLIDRPDGPVVVEVNPRLSVGYVGLSHVLGWNPAGEILALFQTTSAEGGRGDAPV